MVKFDAFAGRIKIGGHRSMHEIKILICYILESVKTPMTRNQICDVLQKRTVQIARRLICYDCVFLC